MSLLFATLAIAAFIGALTVLSVAARPAGAAGRALRTHSLTVAWIVAAVATGGSLYYSEIAGYPPCELCWYQRIAMYPLSVVLLVALLRRDLSVRRYVLPVVAIGSLVSIYHYVLQRFPSLTSASCDLDNPCTLTWVWEYHFVSIPLMALAGFTFIAALMIYGGGDR
jgi:disulfide bond formation protein DsbB